MVYLQLPRKAVHNSPSAAVNKNLYHVLSRYFIIKEGVIGKPTFFGRGSKTKCKLQVCVNCCLHNPLLTSSDFILLQSISEWGHFAAINVTNDNILQNPYVNVYAAPFPNKYC